MADIIWPAGLPQAPLVRGHNQKDESRTQRTKMDVGPAKLRPRATAWVELMAIELVLTRAQVALLKTFFRDTSKAGSLAFDWKHPETAAAVEMRFTDEPTFSPRAPRQAAAAEYWTVSFGVEVLPAAQTAPPPPPPPPGDEDPGAFVYAEGDGSGGELLGGMVAAFPEPDTVFPVDDSTPYVFVTPITTGENDQGGFVYAQDDGSSSSSSSPGPGDLAPGPGGEVEP